MSSEDEEIETELEDDENGRDVIPYSGGPSGKGGFLVFHESFKKLDFLVMRISDVTGDIQLLEKVGKPWREIDKTKGSAALTVAGKDHESVESE